ncbi:hypothetical protein C8R48DRAFT_204170 [Suillus tomentosus]|nr:hypothetical protein C8R48DRAFT_204170 [Suillus tomentosus]
MNRYVFEMQCHQLLLPFITMDMWYITSIHPSSIQISTGSLALEGIRYSSSLHRCSRRAFLLGDWFWHHSFLWCTTIPSCSFKRPPSGLGHGQLQESYIS